MEKDRDKTYNGSYLYRLNQELSGQAELDPYYTTAGLADSEETAELIIGDRGGDEPAAGEGDQTNYE